MKESAWKTWIGKCDELLRAGRLNEAAAMLSALDLKKVPRQQRLELAGLCRRANLLNLGLRLLTPVVHDRLGEAVAKATPHEWAEYAVLLQRSGGVREAINILSRPGMQNFAQAPMYTAYCYFNLWEYGAAIPFLQKYLSGDLTDYARLIGNTNLAAAFNFNGQSAEGALLAAQNSKIAKAKGFVRLQCNNLELLAQSHFESKDYKQARRAIETASSVLSGVGTIDQLYIRKWGAALKAVETKNATPLANFRAEALREKHFESVREADLLSLQIEFSEESFRKLYFGTPFQGYRARIERVLERKMNDLECIHGSATAPSRLNLQTGELTGFNVDFPVGTGIHQCLEVLLRDLYKPLSVCALFSELFPGEYFDIESSPNRVHQVVSRTRRWLTDNDFPMELEEQDGRYLLSVDKRLQVVVGLRAQLAEWESVQVLRLKKRFPESAEMSAGEIRDVLQLTPANFKRLSVWAVENGALIKKGVRAGTTYIFPIKSAA